MYEDETTISLFYLARDNGVPPFSVSLIGHSNSISMQPNYEQVPFLNDYENVSVNGPP
jgi:hypothetical protein